MDSQNIHSIILQLKSITESIDKIVKGVGNPWTVWISSIMAFGTFILAGATIYIALATFRALKEDRNKLKEEKKGANKIFIERIKMYLTATLKIEELTNTIINSDKNKKIDFIDNIKLSAANRSLNATGKLPAGISAEDINNIYIKYFQIYDNIKLISGYFERKDEYAIFINKPQAFSANVIRKIVTLFDYIPQFINNFKNHIEQNKLNEAKIELFWMKLFCIETIMALITEKNLKLQEETYYYNVYKNKDYNYSVLINCCSKFINDMNEDKFINQNKNDAAISKLNGRIQNIIKEFKISKSIEIEDIEICKMFQ